MNIGTLKPPGLLLRLSAVFLALTLGPVCAHANFTAREDVTAFVEEIAARNGLEPASIYAALSRANHLPRVIDLIKPPATRGVRSWHRYRGQFLTHTHIEAGLKTWARYEKELRQAEKHYGVPPEIILAILGVETIYGQNTGNFEALSTLATLAFDYPPRADLFRRELESLFLLAREQNRNPASYKGSYAGALGWPQFLPSSVLRFAVDFNGDGKIDFDNNGIDAIGSIANYLREHGWIEGAPVAVRVRIIPGMDPAPLIGAGIEPSLSHVQLLSGGVRPIADSLPDAGDATLVDLETPGANTEYWLGYRNFYVITRYNRSSFYAMSVFQLAEALRTGYKDGNLSNVALPKAKPATTRKAAPAAKPAPRKKQTQQRRAR